MRNDQPPRRAKPAPRPERQAAFRVGLSAESRAAVLLIAKGFRILARRDSVGVRLISRAGNDFSSRFPFIAKAVGKLPVRSCLIDGSDQDRTLPPQNTSLLCTFCGLLATLGDFVHSDHYHPWTLPMNGAHNHNAAR